MLTENAGHENVRRVNHDICAVDISIVVIAVYYSNVIHSVSISNYLNP